MLKRMRRIHWVTLLVAIVVLVTAVGVVAALAAPGSQPGGGAAGGPLDRDAAIQKALVAAQAESFAVDRAFASVMTLGAWAASTGASPSDPAEGARSVWVVVFKGSGREGEFPFTPHDNLEVVVDQENGRFVGFTYRNPGVPPPFPLSD